MDIAKIRKKLKGQGEKRKKAPAVKKSKKKVDTDEKAPETGLSGQEEDKKAGGAGSHTPEKRAAAEKAKVPVAESVPALDAEEGAGEEKVVELLMFSLNGEDYAFRVSEVEELLRPHRITKVPMTDPYVLGVTSMRGRIIPVVDIEKRLAGTSGSEKVGRSKILVIRGPGGSVGVLVGTGMEFIALPIKNLVEPPAHLKAPASAYIVSVASIGRRFVSIIDTEELLNFKANLEAQ
jgi:purine-binding chemotaxis protein CheW